MNNINPENIKASINDTLNHSNNTKESAEDKIFLKYKHLQITDTTPIPTPVPVITINGETISTEGNVTTISGASKSGKSAFTGVIIAGAIAPGEYDGFAGVEITSNNGKAVVHIDTEQARHKHQFNLRSTLKRAGLDKCPDNFLSFNIREEAPENYETITSELINAAEKKFNGVHLIVIDGGADYIPDVNAPIESNGIVKFFENLAITYKAPVIIIVHVNPGTDKERGHLGSQLQRKSESILTVKTQGDISCLEPKFLRNAGKGDLPLIQFMFDKEKGYHVYCGIKPVEEQSQKDIKRITEIQKNATDIFLPTSAFTYSEALDKIMKHTNKQEATAKKIFKEMKAHSMILQSQDKKWRINEMV
ncbi:MAG: hypothetical protein ACLQQ4_12685 [Bacteroidia bacterium]